MSETIILPPSCSERFLRLPHPGCRPLRDRGIISSGVSRVVPGYRIHRDPGHSGIVLFTVSGRGRFRSEGVEHELAPGSLWYRPFTAEQDYGTEEEWGFVWYHLRADAKVPLLAHAEPTRPLLRASVRASTLRAQSELLIDEVIRDESDPLIRALSETVALLLMRELSSGLDARTAELRRRLDELWQAVLDRPGHAWRVAELAARFHQSAANFNRVVLREEGTTPKRKVTLLRMERARDYLSHTDYPLDAIARAVGYSDGYSFSKAFLRHAGCRPGVYRARDSTKKR